MAFCNTQTPMEELSEGKKGVRQKLNDASETDVLIVEESTSRCEIAVAIFFYCVSNILDGQEDSLKAFTLCSLMSAAAQRVNVT